MHKQDNTKKPDSHSLDEKLWQKIRASKTVQGLAWKIEKAMQADDESRALVKMLVEKWAELVGVRQYFPDLKDVFTPDAIFYIEYAHKEGIEDYPKSQRTKAGGVYSVLAYISNIVARHEITPRQLKRKYNSEVQRWGETLEVLSLFDVGEVEDGRISTSKKFFTPKNAPTPKPAKKKLVKSTLTAGFDWPYYGVHKDDVLTIEENGEVKIGQLAFIQHDENPDVQYFSRVCLIKGDTVRVCGGKGDEPHDELRSRILGVVVKVNHEDCAPTKIEALRRQIAKLENDTDAWANSTKIYELETKIYNLEHPPTEVEEEEISWLEVIGDE
jgi:hypothetical protein